MATALNTPETVLKSNALTAQLSWPSFRMVPSGTSRRVASVNLIMDECETPRTWLFVVSSRAVTVQCNIYAKMPVNAKLRWTFQISSTGTNNRLLFSGQYSRSLRLTAFNTDLPRLMWTEVYLAPTPVEDLYCVFACVNELGFSSRKIDNLLSRNCSCRA